MRDKSEIKTALKTGLGLGMLAGLFESLFVLATVDSPGDLGAIPALEVAFWGLFGVVCGIAPLVLSSQRRSDSAGLGAVSAARVAILLTTLFVAGQVNVHLSPVTLLWKRLALNLLCGAGGVLLWLGSAPAMRIRSVKSLFSGIAKAWPYMVVVSATGAAGLVLGIDRSVTFSHFHPAEPAQASRHAAAPRLLLLGLDGATWDILMPLVEEGRMPNLRGLMGRGKWGTLRSYVYSASPVVWTSIMTGKGPEDHGITTFTTGKATNRRVKPVWQIASEAGRRCAVLNVPGTYPVLGDCAVMMSGFPLPGGASFGNVGWLVTTGEGPIYRSGLSLRLDFDPQAMAPGARVRIPVELRDLPASIPSRDTVPVLLVRALSEDQAYRLQRALYSTSLGEIELNITNDRALGDFVIEGFAGEKLFTLTRNEWSDWLVASIDGRDYSFKVHFVDTSKDELTLFVTPLYALPDASRARPAEQLIKLLSRPYVAEPVGATIFADERLLDSLRIHLMDTASCRHSAALAILDHFDLDVFVCIYTVTDRMQHAMLKFMYPIPYRELAEREGGDFERLKPTKAQVVRFGGVIRAMYYQADEWLGDLLQRAGPDTMVVLVSDHGFAPGRDPRRPTSGVHHPDGIYVIAKALDNVIGGEPASELAGSRGPELVLEDVAPIALHLLGMPAATDMTGRVPGFLASEDRPIVMIATYEDRQGRVEASEELDPAALEQLRSIGYVD